MNVSRVLPRSFICTPPQAPKEKASQGVRMETLHFYWEGRGGGRRGRNEGREEKRREGLLFLVPTELLLRDSREGPIPHTFLCRDCVTLSSSHPITQSQTLCSCQVAHCFSPLLRGPPGLCHQKAEAPAQSGDDRVTRCALHRPGAVLQHTEDLDHGSGILV